MGQYKSSKNKLSRCEKLLAKYVFTEHFEMSELVHGLLENENELTMNCLSIMYGFLGLPPNHSGQFY